MNGIPENNQYSGYYQVHKQNGDFVTVVTVDLVMKSLVFDQKYYKLHESKSHLFITNM
jgi:hypothetical protein